MYQNNQVQDLTHQVQDNQTANLFHNPWKPHPPPPYSIIKNVRKLKRWMCTCLTMLVCFHFQRPKEKTLIGLNHSYISRAKHSSKPDVISCIMQFYIIWLLFIKLSRTKGRVSSLLATRHDLPDPTAPSPYPLTLPSPPMENAW